MTVQEFHRRLRETGAYSTPSPPCPPPAPRAGLMLRYHAGVARDILGGAWDAWRGRFDDAAWARHAYGIQRTVERCGGTVAYEGFAVRAAWQGPVVYAANHMSALETLVLPGALMAFGPVCVVLKESLRRYPVFGASIRRIAPITVTRRHARADLAAVLEQGTQRLAAGRSVVLFPQHTRSARFEAAHFNSLAAKLAQRGRVPLLPVALCTAFAGLGRVLKDFGPVDPRRPVRFAAGPLLPPDLPPREMQAAMLAFLSARLREWGVDVA
jgi:1-acyl-sn-glycerol-3-phosphate acyltransferase